MIELNTFLQVLFRYCTESTISCAFARHYDISDKFSKDHRDIDILLKKSDIPQIIRFLQAWPDVKLVNIVTHANNTQLYIYGINQQYSPFICLDIHHKLALKGINYLNVNAVLLRKEQIEQSVFFQPHALDLALIYLFTHILKHNTISDSAKHAIIHALKNKRLAFNDSMETYFGPQGLKVLQQCLDHNNKSAAKKLHQLFINRQIKVDMISTTLTVIASHCQTLFQRMFINQDIRIVIMGTDGSGKTTLAGKLISHLGYLRSFIIHAHLLPVMPGQKSPDSQKVNSDPHGKPKRNWLLSNIKLVYYFVLYWLDALLPRRASRLVIYDRYLVDILIDPLRFRFGGSVSLAKFILHLLPKIDFYIWVSTPPSIAYGRKPEVPLPTMTQHYEAYKNLTESLSNATAYNVSDSVENLVLSLATSLERQCS